MKIKEKQFCIKKFEGNGLTELIEKYMICAHDRGMLDAEGYLIEEVAKKTNVKCRNLQREGKTMQSGYEDVRGSIYTNMNN